MKKELISISLSSRWEYTKTNALWDPINSWSWFISIPYLGSSLAAGKKGRKKQEAIIKVYWSVIATWKCGPFRKKTLLIVSQKEELW